MTREAGPAAGRGGGLHPILLAGLALAVGLPVLLARFPPMQDLPVHAMIADIIAHPARHARYFVPALGWRPYAGLYLALAPLASILPAVRAAQLVMAVVTASLPLATIAFAESLRRWRDAHAAAQTKPAPAPAWILVAAFPLVFTQSYYLGFSSYLLGTLLAILGWTSCVGCMRFPGRAAPPIATLLFGLCVALVHPLVSLIYAVGLVAVAVWNVGVVLRRPLFAAVLATNVLLPAAVLRRLAPGRDTFTLGHAALEFQGPRFAVRHLLEPLLDLYRTPLRFAAPAGACLLAAGAVLWVVDGTRQRDRATGAAATLFAALLLLFFALPNQAGEGNYYLNVRLNGLVYLMGTAALSVWARPSSRRRAPLCVLLGAALLVATAWDAHLRFDREARSAASVLDAIPPGAAVLSLLFDPRTAVLADREWNNLYLHFVDHRLARVGGDDPGLLPNPLAPARRRPRLPPGPDAFDPAAFRFDEDGVGFGWFLVRGEPTRRVEKDLMSHTREVASAGPWRLWAVVSSEGGGARSSPPRSGGG